jgi:hypothetical protein
MRAINILLLGLLLTGCASVELQNRQSAAARYIGQTERDLLRDIGVPIRIREASGRRFVAYEDSQTRYTKPIPSFTRRWSPFGSSLEVRPEEMVIMTCETTFELENDKVVSFRLHGDGCG